MIQRHVDVVVRISRRSRSGLRTIETLNACLSRLDCDQGEQHHDAYRCGIRLITACIL